MATILPQSISSAHLIAFDETAAAMFEGAPYAAILVHLTNLVPADALDILIGQWGLSGQGVNYATLTDDQKRQLIRQAGYLNAKRGTIWAIRYMFAVFGMPTIEIIEATELNTTLFDDFTWSGPPVTNWEWVDYAVRIVVADATIDVVEETLAAMELVLAEFAPARCRLVNWTIQGRFAETLTISDATQITVI